jgi:putative sigma-54 modulation protein
MKFDVRFKGIDYSESLESYVIERFEKLKKFEIKPLKVQVTFSEQKYERRAEVFIHGLNSNFRAQASSDSYFASLDMCIKKMSRQLEKEKSKIKEHHHPQNNRRAA